MNSGVLTDPTLVLNKHWAPIRVCSVRRALTLVFKNLANVIATENYGLHDFSSWVSRGVDEDCPHIRTVGRRIPVPEVIVLHRYDRYIQPRVVFSRRNLYRRDRYTCQYCAKRYPSERLSIDHVVPRSQGGGSSWTNCVVACTRCNARKGNRSPEKVGMRTLQPPREPPPHMAFTLQWGERKPSWEHFVRNSGWTSSAGS